MGVHKKFYTMQTIPIKENRIMTIKPSIKKLLIKNFRGNNTLPPVESFIAHNLICFEDSIFDIFNGHNCTSTYEELYHYADNLCTCLGGNNYLSTFCRAAMKTYLDQYVDMLVAIDEDGDFLLELTKLWVNFCKYTIIVSNICLCYDRKLILTNEDPTNDDLLTIGRMGIELFRNQIVLHPFLQTRIVNVIFQFIESARLDEENLNSDVLFTVVSMFLRLDLYQELFVNKLLQTTLAFYKEQSTIHLNSMDVVDYLKYANKKIEDEGEMITRFNLNESRSMIMLIMIDNLLTQKFEAILSREGQLFAIYESKDREILSILYKLFKMVPEQVKMLSLQFGTYIVTKGSEIIKTKSVFKQIVEKTLTFKQDIDDVVSNCFENSSCFLEAIRISFKTCLNGNCFAKYLAQYVDVHLRSKDMDHSDATLNNIMVLFRYLQSKDVFQAFYYKHFAKRLLIGKSSSQDAEKSMISKLRLECGEGFTSKLEGMMKDMELSQTVNSSFKSNLKATDNNLDLNVHVLTMSFWPNFSNSRVVLGDEFQQFQEIFTEYYSKHFQKRKLLWQPSLGNCILKAHFNNGKAATKELQLSMIQAALLLRFNTCLEYVLQDLMTISNLPQKEFTRQLIGLIKSKVLLLSNSDESTSNEEEEGFKYNPEDTIKVNVDFSGKMFRIKVGQGPVMRDTHEEEQAIEKRVTHERQFNVDAAIVRIMKKTRRLSHNELVAQLFQLVETPSTTNDFKKRIELLIEREYIQRDKDDPDIYNYVA